MWPGMWFIWPASGDKVAERVGRGHGGLGVVRHLHRMDVQMHDRRVLRHALLVGMRIERSHTRMASTTSERRAGAPVFTFQRRRGVRVISASM